MESIRIVKPSNLHVHFRQDDDEDKLMPILVPVISKTSYYSVAMPNPNPPIKTGKDAVRYSRNITAYVPKEEEDSFCPITPIKMLWGDDFKTTPKIIEEAYALGISWVKMYMRGVTTNSNDGIAIENIKSLYPTFKKMQELDFILLIHGEHPGKDVLATEREYRFHPYFLQIHKEFPDLKIVFEHISDHRTIKLIKEMPKNIAGTLSTHFLYMTLNDVVEPGLRPKNSCKPIAKDFIDRETIIEAAISGDTHWFWGSDIAGHIISKKYMDKGHCGCFPGQYDLLWTVKKFDEMNALHNLEKFVSLNGPRFYNLPIPDAKIILQKVEDYETDKMYHNIEIWNGGELLNWRIEK